MKRYDREFVVMIGNIGSGKSTLIPFLVKEGYVVVSRDSLRYMLGAGKYTFDSMLEPCVFQSEKKILRSLMTTGVNIVVDEVGMSRWMRAYYLKLCKRRRYKATAIVMKQLDMETCVDRRMQDPHGQHNRKLWEGVWTHFDKVYQEPSFSEGFKRIVRL